MPSFRYRALGPSGETLHGVMEAATEADVVARLQRQGSLPMHAEPAEHRSWLGALLAGRIRRRPGAAAPGGRRSHA